MKLSLLSILVLAFTVPLVFGVPLYRNGNASKPYAKVRTPQDYDDPVDGIVPANPKKGVCTCTLCSFALIPLVC